MGDHLFHYTCEDGARGIDRDGILRPNLHPWLDRPVAWLTDLNEPWRDALGLTGHSLTCDRTAVRYEVTDRSTCIRWTTWARTLTPDVRRAFETAAPGLRPMHWWVSLEPVPVLSRMKADAHG